MSFILARLDVITLTLKPTHKYKQISNKNAKANKSAFPQCFEQSAVTLKQLSTHVTQFVPVNLPLKVE